jgi:hypothetical protein
VSQASSVVSKLRVIMYLCLAVADCSHKSKMFSSLDADLGLTMMEAPG